MIVHKLKLEHMIGEISQFSCRRYMLTKLSSTIALEITFIFIHISHNHRHVIVIHF